MSRGIEQAIKVGDEKMAVDRWRCRASVEEQPTISSTEAQSIDLAVEKLLRRQELSRSIHQVSRRCRDCDKKTSLEARQIAKCRGGVEQAFKNSFSRREKYRYECNQTCNTTNDWNTIWTSQKHLSTAILSTWIPKTHTHTLNKSNRFLF